MARRNYGFSWTIARIKARPVRFQYGLSSTFQSLLGLNFSTGYTFSHIHFYKIKSLVIVMIMMHKLFRYILCYVGCIFFSIFIVESHYHQDYFYSLFFFINIRILLSSTGNNTLVKMISDIFLRRITHFLIIVAEDLLVVVITY